MTSPTIEAISIIHLNMIQAVAFAAVTYYFGQWLKSKVAWFNRFAISAPVVGGMTVASVLSILESYGVLRVEFDTTLQSQLMLAFFTTIGLMASIKVVKTGGRLLLGFLAVVSLLAVVQNLLGMGLAQLMGIDRLYGILAGSVSMMGGLGTAAAFGPYFEQTYGITGGTALGITAATFGMAASLMVGGPFAQWLVKRYRVQTPVTPAKPEPALHIPEEVDLDIEALKNSDQEASWKREFMKSSTIVLLCMGAGSIVSGFLNEIITLPAYIGAMIVAAIVRNVADFSGKLHVEGKGLNTIADVSLILFVTMAINALKLHELMNLALPLMVMMIAQTILAVVFAYFFIWKLFKQNYTSVMLTAGGIGFSMGATANGLANMQGLAEKYGPCSQAWLIVSLVGAFLIDLINAIIITMFAAL